MRKPQPQDALRVNWNGLDLAAARTVLEALQALDRGEATADQQRVALAALRDMFCRAPLLSFSTEPLLMAALEGRRSVWIEFDRAVKSDLGTLRGETDGGS